MSLPSAEYTTVVFLPTPAGILDLASLSFQVPRLGFWAKLTVRARRHSTNVTTMDLIFTESPSGFEKQNAGPDRPRQNMRRRPGKQGKLRGNRWSSACLLSGQRLVLWLGERHDG